jgi:predicted nuclease of predicted toxin-antitoxin system
MIRLYMDVHVHGAITQALRDRGADVLTAQEDGAAELLDPDLLDRAAQLGRLLFTQDKDFLRIATERQRKGEPFQGVCYAAQSNAMLGNYIDDLDLIAIASDPEEYANRVVYLPL